MSRSPATGQAPRGLSGARLGRIAAVLALVTVAARAAGFARTVVFGREVGRTCLGSVYAAANGVPNILFEVAAGGALSAVAVPLLARRFAAADLPGAGRTASALLTWTVIVLAPLTVIAALLARPIVSALLGPANGCDRAAAVTAGTRMLLVFAIQIVLYGVGIVVGGILQAAGRFLGPAIAPLLSSVVVMASYVVFGAGGSRVEGTDLAGLTPGRLAVLAGGTTLGVVVLSLGLVLPLSRVGIRLRPTLRFDGGDGRAVASLALAGLASVAAQQAATAVVIRLSNDVRVDSYVIHLLGATVFLLPWAILAVPIATGVFPRLSAAKDGGQAGTLAAPALRAAVILMCAGAAALVATARPVAAVLLLGAPGQGAQAPGALAFAIVAFAPGLLGYGVWAVAARVLFARRAAGAAAVMTVAGWLVVIAADLALVHGATGETVAARLAMGQSVGLTIAGVGTLIAVGRVTGSGVYDGVSRALAWGLVAAGAAALAGRAVADALGSSAVAASVGTAVASASVVTIVFAAVLAVVDRRDLRALTDAWCAGVAEQPRVPVVGFVLAETAGGIGRHVRDVAAGLAERGQPAYVVAPAAVIERFDLATVAAATAVEVGDPRSFPAARRELRRLYVACDVVHAHGLRAGALAARSRPPGGAPLVVTWHNQPPSRGVAARVGAQLARSAARGAAITLAVSDDLVALAVASGSADARWTPVSAPLLPPATRPAAEVRAELGATGRSLVLAVGRLAPQKGFDTLAAAADTLADETNAPVIAVAGDGPERDRLSPSALLLLGPRDDIADLIAAADVVVIPSRWEGWPLVAQEALRAGAALVATPVGGLPRLAGDAAAWVTPADDPAALAAVLRRVLADDAERSALRAAAVRRAADLPDAEATLDGLLRLYREVTGS